MTQLQTSIHNTSPTNLQSTTLSAINVLLDRYQYLLEQHRTDNPDLYRLVDLKKQLAVVPKQPILPVDDNPRVLTHHARIHSISWALAMI